NPDEFNVPATFALPRSLEVSAFRAAVHRAVNDIDALRTRIVDSDGTDLQSVSSTIAYQLPVVRDSSTEWIEHHGRRPFRLDESLFDSALIDDPERGWIWCLNQHHIVTDVWSIRLIGRRVADVYRALRQRVAPPRYVARPYERLVATNDSAVETCASDSGFWRERLSEPVGAPPLYGVRGRAMRRPFRRWIALGRERSAAIAAASRAGGGESRRSM